MIGHRTKTLYDLFRNLDSAEKELRNRRLFEEADAVKFARDTLLEEAVDLYQEQEKSLEITPGYEN